MNDNNKNDIVDKQYEAQVTISNVKTTGILIISKDELIIRVNNQEMKVPYNTIDSSIITMENEVKLTLTTGAIIVVSIYNNDILLDSINQKKEVVFNEIKPINPITEDSNQVDNSQQVEIKQGVCVIRGSFNESTPIKVYDGESLITSIKSGEKFVYQVKQDTILTFKFRLFKSAQVEVNANENVMIMIGIDWLRSKVSAEVTGINDVDMEEATREEQPISNSNSRGFRFSFGKIIVLGIIIYIIYNMFFAPMTESKICSRIQSSVSKYLKDPSSAKFSNDCRVIKKDNNLWTVTGTVSGTNGFGGVASHGYSVVVRVDGHSYEIKGVMVG